VEGEQAVQVGEDGGAQVTRTLGVSQSVEAGQRLGGEQHVGAVLGQLAKDLLVVGAGDGVQLVDGDRDRAPFFGRERRLSTDGTRGQVEQRAADERGGVLSDLEHAQVDNHYRTLGDQLAEVDSGGWLADDLAGGERGQVLVDLGLDRVDDLQPQPRVERLEVGVEPLLDHRVGGALEDAAPKTAQR
jgi:hypothetical protein